MKQIILNEIKKIINERIKWTKELVQDEAIKYNTRVEFQKKSANAYEAARRNGWLDDVTGHMIKLKREQNFENCVKDIINFIKILYQAELMKHKDITYLVDKYEINNYQFNVLLYKTYEKYIR